MMKLILMKKKKNDYIKKMHSRYGEQSWRLMSITISHMCIVGWGVGPLMRLLAICCLFIMITFTHCDGAVVYRWLLMPKITGSSPA